MKIVVTGAAGFIGSHLAERLADLGYEVVGIDAFTDYYSLAWKETNAADVQSRGVIMHRLDLAADELTAVLHNADFIFHLAGQPGISVNTSFETYIRNNLVATYRLLEASRQLTTLKCFVNISTSSVYGAFATDNEEAPPKPTSSYGVTKLAAEQLVLAYQRERGFPACSCRIFSVYGPRERPEKLYPKLIRSILTGEPFPLHEGSRQHSRSYTYVDDIVDGFLAVIGDPERVVGEIFNIGSEIEMTTGDGIRIIEEIMGQKATLKIMPKRPGDQLHTCANIKKARQLLGYNPQTRLEEGLRTEVDWYREKIYKPGIY